MQVPDHSGALVQCRVPFSGLAGGANRTAETREAWLDQVRGGPPGTRTPYLDNANVALSQMS